MPSSLDLSYLSMIDASVVNADVNADVIDGARPLRASSALPRGMR